MKWDIYYQCRELYHIKGKLVHIKAQSLILLFKESATCLGLSVSVSHANLTTGVY